MSRNSYFETVDLLKYLWKRNSETVDKIEYHAARRHDELVKLREALMKARPFIYAFTHAKAEKKATKLLKEIEAALSPKFVSFATWKKRKKKTDAGS